MCKFDLALLAIFVLWEGWLGKTKLLRANSTVALIGDSISALFKLRTGFIPKKGEEEKK